MGGAGNAVFKRTCGLVPQITSMWILLSILLVLVLELLRRNRSMQAALRAQVPPQSSHVSTTALTRQFKRLQWLREQQTARAEQCQPGYEQSWLAFFSYYGSSQCSPQALALFCTEQLLVSEGPKWSPALEARIRGILRRRNGQQAELVQLSSDGLLDDLSPFGIGRWLLLCSTEGQSAGQKSAAQAPVCLWAGFAPRAELPRADELLRLRREFELRIAQQQTRESLSRQASESQQRAAHQERVLAQISHDIRSPLLSVSAALYGLREVVSSAEDQQLVKSSLHSCQQVSELLDDLLDVVRDASSVLSARPMQVELTALVSELSQALLPLARSKGLSIDLEKGLQQGAAKIWVQVDPRHFRRMLSNLLSNAIKYTRRGSIQLRLLKPNARIALEVSDSGIGMSQEQIQRLCEPFQRFAPEEASGVGLGLAVTRALIKANQGELEVHSEVGKGSTFRLLLPAANAPELCSPANEQQNQSSGGPLRVLLLDDDPAVVSSLQRLLQRQGYQVEGLSTLEQLAPSLEREQPDAFISDAELQTSGIKETAAVLTSAGYRGRWIVLSGDAGQESLALQAGARAFFLKPVAIGELIGALQARSTP
jgi:signal transduction histidine kinase